MLSVSALIYSCTITFLAKQTYSRAIKKLAFLASLRDIKPYAWIFEKRISKAKDSFYYFATGLICNAQITSTAANQTTTKNYIGLTEGTFKQRYTQHKSTFTHRKLSNSTELSKYIWQLKDSNTSFSTKWSIIARARPYHNSSKRCDLCLAEKLYIIKCSNSNLLNKRSELVSKCRHENKFFLKNNWRSSYTITIVLRSSTSSVFQVR